MADRSSEARRRGSHFAPKQNPKVSSKLPTLDDSDAKIMGTGTISSRSVAATRHVAKGSKRRHHGMRTRAAQAHLGNATHGRQQPNKAHWPRVLMSLILVAFILGAAYIFVLPMVKDLTKPETPQVETGKQVTITIPEGSGAASIIQQLLDAGVISDQASFANALKQQGADSKLKPGTYNFFTGSKDQNVIDLLIAGPNASANTVTIPEGSTVAQTAAYVEATLKIPAKDFMSQAKASKYAGDYAFLKEAAATEQDSLEGYLYPKTYNFDGKDTSADAVIRTMLDQYVSELSKQDFDAAKKKLKSNYNVELSDYQLLKLASIIEKEAIKDDQRANISSVFYNRLKAGMALQSDTTMAYALGHEIKKPEENHQDSPYNSYDHQGVSIATPICSPSLASIQAALEPASTDYLYFWITQKAEHFSKTEAEHTKTYNEHLSS